ncbi:MAG: M81 family metallopeptidase [Caulobacteraceae bacterium]
MRIFCAGLNTETNTFIPQATGLRGFEIGGIHRGDASSAGLEAASLAARVWRDLAAGDGHEFVEGLFATAHPSGETLRGVYEQLRDEILADIAARGPFDVVLLFLHGAMVAHGYQDCEADLAGGVRALVGPSARIGVELDPHCHLSQTLVDSTDAVVILKTYPHVDYAERAADLYDLCTRAAEGKVAPTSALFDCRMIGFYPTVTEPMRGLVERSRQAEREPGILSVSFAHGFPWGDVWDTGSKMLVIADGDAELARTTAERLGRELYDRRAELLPRYPTMIAALEQAAGLEGLVVLGDTADNPGGGAPGDNPAFLRLLLERGVADAALGCLWDPMAVLACVEAGVGAELDLRVGGKTGPVSGEPLDVRCQVRAIRENHEQAGLARARSPLGLSAWIVCAGIDVVLCSTRSQTFSPEAFTGLGVDLAGKKIVVVKSSNHYRNHFAALTPHLINVATPGAIQMDFAAIEYRRRRPEPYYPKIADPLAR